MQIFILLVGLASSFVSHAVGQEVHCGTTSDATLSDCHNLVDNIDNWNAAFNTNNFCTFGVVTDGGFYAPLANNVACLGDCCVYVSGGANIDRETTRLRAQSLFGCGSVDNNSINVLGIFDLGQGVCISDGNGCGDCFDDSDFSRRTKRAPRPRVLLGRERY